MPIQAGGDCIKKANIGYTFHCSMRNAIQLWRKVYTTKEKETETWIKYITLKRYLALKM